MAELQKEEVAKLIQEEIEKNNNTLLASMKSLMGHSVEHLKRTSTETAESQIKEIKKLKYSEPHKFKKKAKSERRSIQFQHQST